MPDYTTKTEPPLKLNWWSKESIEGGRRHFVTFGLKTLYEGPDEAQAREAYQNVKDIYEKRKR